MPYRDSNVGTPTWPGAGDDDAADFLVDVLQPFLTDAKVAGGLGWISQDPAGGAGGGGVFPNYQRLYSRGGIGTEAAPFWFFQTTAKTLWIFSGNGVNTAQEPYDQPGNPMNEPFQSATNREFQDPTDGLGLLRTLAMTTLAGPFESFWLFGGDTGQYCHVVLKVGPRQYRHFHAGLLDPLHPDLPAGSFYITNHRWDSLEPDNIRVTSDATQWNEHRQYKNHILPFRNRDDVNTGFTGGFSGDVRSMGSWHYVPGFGSEAYDWWFPTGQRELPVGETGSVLGRARNSSGNFNDVSAVVKTSGEVNNGSDVVSFGSAFITGYDKSLGTIPWACEPSFTSDGIAFQPIVLLLPSDFATNLRWAPVARVPDVFRVNMKSRDAEEEITVGSDTYTVFPLMNKDSANTLENEGYSGYEGLAYKKITANAT